MRAPASSAGVRRQRAVHVGPFTDCRQPATSAERPGALPTPVAHAPAPPAAQEARAQRDTPRPGPLPRHHDSCAPGWAGGRARLLGLQRLPAPPAALAQAVQVAPARGLACLARRQRGLQAPSLRRSGLPAGARLRLGPLALPGLPPHAHGAPQTSRNLGASRARGRPARVVSAERGVRARGGGMTAACAPARLPPLHCATEPEEQMRAYAASVTTCPGSLPVRHREAAHLLQGGRPRLLRLGRLQRRGRPRCALRAPAALQLLLRRSRRRPCSLRGPLGLCRVCAPLPAPACELRLELRHALAQRRSRARLGESRQRRRGAAAQRPLPRPRWRPAQEDGHLAGAPK